MVWLFLLISLNVIFNAIQQMTKSRLYYILIVLIHILISNHTYAETESSTDLPCRYVTTLSVGSASDENRSLFFDHQGLLWVGTNSGLKSFDGYEVRVFKSTAASPSLLPNNTVVSIGEDGNGDMWIGTRNGLVRMNMRTGETHTYSNVPGVSRITYALFTASNGTVWVGNDHGLSRYVPETDSFINYRGDASKVIMPNGEVRKMDWYSVKSIVEDDKGNLFVGTWDSGLLRFSPEDETFVAYPQLNVRNSAYSLFIDSKQRLWVGTWGYGLIRIDNPLDVDNLKMYTYNQGKGSFDTFYTIIEDPITHTIWASSREGVIITDIDADIDDVRMYTTCDNGGQQLRFCNNMVTDRNGNIWIETLNDGIVHINTKPSNFDAWNFSEHGYNLPVNSVCSVFADSTDEVWITMKPYGVVCIDNADGKAQFNRDIKEFASLPDDFMHTSITSICRNANGELWFANNSYGIAVYRKGQLVRQLTTQNSPFIVDNYVNSLMSDRNGNMWIGQGGALSVALTDGGGLRIKLEEDGIDFSACDVRGLMEDSRGYVWVATEDKGIIRIKNGSADELANALCHHYCPQKGNYVVNDATSCFEDSRGRIWAISNSGGLFLLDALKDCFVSVNDRYNIPSDRIFTINEDSFGSIWLSVDNGLIRFRPDDEAPCTIYGKDDGLDNMLFFPNASCQFGNTLLFACQTGFFFFDAAQLNKPKDIHAERLIVTDLLIDDVRYEHLDSATRLDISELMPSYTTKVTIPASVDKFTFVFALLSYNSISQISYSYQLEGYDTDWQNVGHRYNSATFQNIPVGHYTLRLRATDASGITTETIQPITIIVLPPWYASGWARICYVILGLFMLIVVVKWYRNRLIVRSRLHLNEILINITHELLTPLAVISASVDVIRDKAPEFGHTYALIHNNIIRLTRLLRQILEMSKSQAGQLKLLVSRGNLSNFVADTCQNISTLVNRNSCSLQLDIAPGIDAWFDSDKIDKILYNLLSNAQKYNRSGGVVTVSLSTTNDNRDAVLSIADQGVGIAPERMKRLYSRFFDGDYRRINQTGTGIGLALTYELVNLHHGTIYCESKVDVGTKFTVVFPIGSEAYAEDEIDTEEKISVVDVPSVVSAKAEKSIEVSTSDEEQYHILIVEDNEELLDVMVQLLSRRYRVFTAHNGKQALNVIKREELDLIISDVMMPVMDGYELTRTIKNDPDYCQLPIVLLTAKVRASDRKEGLEFGADEYLTKPFSLDELQLRIDNIIANRERIKQRFMASLKNAADEPADEHISNPDDVFLQKAIDCVERNIENSNYDRDAFSADMCVSSSTLYNKLRALTGNSITGFITSVRLKRACAIAKQNPQISIAELSDKVGFATPKYFSKCFKKEYGMLLREWLEQEN